MTEIIQALTQICTQCRVKKDVQEYVHETTGRAYVTCCACRSRSLRASMKKRLEKKNNDTNWKEENQERIRQYNEFYRQHQHLSSDERRLLWEKWKEEHGVTDKNKGIMSHHRKPHTEQNGVMGKMCSVPGCGWKPLTSFNFKKLAWDQLRTTCKLCLSKKRKKYLQIKPVNIEWKIRQSIHGRIVQSLKRVTTKPNGKSSKNPIPRVLPPLACLGCSLEEFKRHLESLFTEGMSWDTYGQYVDDQGNKQMGFHIDHIIPCCAFDLSDPVQLLLCFHWKNCQPLWARENLVKNGTYRMEDKLLYIESMKDIIDTDSVKTLVQTTLQQVEKEKKEIERILLHRTKQIQRQQQLYEQYQEQQMLEAVQLLFFRAESSFDEKNYKTTPFSLMKNHASRKSGAENPVSKQVVQVSLDGMMIRSYDSMNIAAKQNGTFHSVISKCCSSPQKLYQANGFHWCFVKDVDQVRHGIRWKTVMTQLRQSRPRWKTPCPKHPPSPRSETIKKQISESMKNFFASEEGKTNKQKALEKRSKTIKERRENNVDVVKKS